ncbi:MAG TPA: hypothetical protein VM686_19770 [Polyangiaceae bacterium]|nr:hypothetical protein [Polyangiaceae bacterium]
MEFSILGSTSSARALALSLLVSTAVGCGGSKPPASKTPVPEAKAEPSEPLEEAADLAPVPAPNNLVLVGRLQRPITVVDTATRWAGLPLSVRQLLGAHAWIEPIVAWDAPVQVAGVVEGKSTPEPIVVVSVGLTSLDKAVTALRDQGHSLRRVSPGVYQIAGDEPSCFVAASRGPAPARLVCGENARGTEKLVPFATRGLPDMPAGKADLEVEFTAEPLQRMFAQQLSSLTFLSGFAIRQLSIDHAGFDRALADGVYALASELQVLATDIDRVRIEAKLDEAASVIDVSASLKLRSDKSWTGQALADMAKRSTPAPETFWQLPDRATFAGYSVEASAERAKPIARTLAELADGYLDKEKVGRATRERTKTLIADMFSLQGATAFAEGHDLALTANPTPQQRFSQYLGWQLQVVDGPSDGYLRVLRGLHSTLNDRELRKLAAKRLDIDAKELPTSVERPFTAKGVPAGGRAFVITLPKPLVERWAKASPRSIGKDPVALQLTLVVVPDGKRTLTILAMDEKIAAERLAAFKAGAEPTLTQRQDLSALRTNKAWMAGFGSLAGMARFLASLEERANKAQLLDAVPHKGRTSILGSLTVEHDGGTTVRLSGRIPKAVVEDGAALVPQLAPKF